MWYAHWVAVELPRRAGRTSELCVAEQLRLRVRQWDKGLHRTWRMAQRDSPPIRWWEIGRVPSKVGREAALLGTEPRSLHSGQWVHKASVQNGGRKDSDFPCRWQCQALSAVSGHLSPALHCTENAHGATMQIKRSTRRGDTALAHAPDMILYRLKCYFAWALVNNLTILLLKCDSVKILRKL